MTNAANTDPLNPQLQRQNPHADDHLWRRCLWTDGPGKQDTNPGKADSETIDDGELSSFVQRTLAIAGGY